MKLWQLILCAPGLIALGSVLWSTYLLYLQFRKPPHQKNISDFTGTQNPGVSILKPLKGIDADLKSNLESFFRLRGTFELIFSVAQGDDPAVAVVLELLQRYPAVAAHLIIGEQNVGLNPKINNLLRGIAEARYDWVLISDSNVHTAENLLEELFAVTEDPSTQVGLVTGVIVGTQPSNWGARLEAMMLNSYYARGMVLAFAVDRPCAVGKAMLFKRSVAQRFGGLKTLSQFLAEDYQAGQAFLQLGYSIKLMKQPVAQVLGALSFQTFWRRHVRWGLLRKTQVPLLFYTEWILTSLLSGALLAVALTSHATASLEVWSLFIAIWMGADACSASLLGAPWTWRSPFDWLVREALHLPIWCAVALKSTVLWRGERLRIGAGGLLET